MSSGTSHSDHAPAPSAPSTGGGPSVPSAQYQSPFGNTLSHPFGLKLDRTNYTLWKTMVSTIIRGHRLDGYINGLKPAPPEFVPATGDEGPGFGVSANPAYEQWIISDQLLMGWLYGSMSESIATEVTGCTSARTLWLALENLFGAHSKARMDELRDKI